MDRPRWLRPKSTTQIVPNAFGDRSGDADPERSRRRAIRQRCGASSSSTRRSAGFSLPTGTRGSGPFLDAGEVQRANDVFAEAQRRLGTPLPDHWYPTILLPDDACATSSPLNCDLWSSPDSCGSSTTPRSRWFGSTTR
ncbi:MAG: hypothetical protein IPG46_18435 [Actinobacteria bacterium]|nr:hypothetical protein [Actinomycetota bacterium]